MTVFYFAENKVCAILKDSFDFFEQANLESISEVLGNLKFSYADDQIGFIIPCSHGNFPLDISEFFEKTTLTADYFFSIIVEGEKSSDASRKFINLCSKFGIKLNYLNSVMEAENIRKIKDRGIAFRSDVGMFVSHIYGLDMRNRIFGIIENLTNKFMRKPSSTFESQKETN